MEPSPSQQRLVYALAAALWDDDTATYSALFLSRPRVNDSGSCPLAGREELGRFQDQK